MPILSRLPFALLCAVLLGQPLAAQAQSAPYAKIASVTAVDGVTERQFFGHVVARQTVDLAFQVGGQITEFPAVEGQPIPMGGLIAQLDAEPFELALAQAQAQAAQAKRTLDRFEQLSGTTVSQASLEDAQTQYELTQISVKDAERNLRQATLTAPFDALVASRNAANFASIGAGAPIVRIHDMSELRMEIEVPEVLFGSAGANPDFEIFARFNTSDTLFPVTPREFNAETSAVGQTFTITLGMAPPEDIIVLPGSSVTVLVRLRTGAPQLLITPSALVTATDGTPQVMVFTPTGADEGAVALRPIEITPTPSGAVQVVSGLEAGDEIIASGAALLSDGDTVRRFTGFSN